MNVFIIPSWYPSATNAITGIFIREQAYLLKRNIPGIGVAISVWGQNDRTKLLMVKDGISNFAKVFTSERTPSKHISREGVVEYVNPRFTWTSKILHGNIESIIRANAENFVNAGRDFGKIDLIHAHIGYPAGYIAYRLSRLFSVPYITSENMSPFPFRYFLNRSGGLSARIRDAYANSRVNICVSSNMETEMKKFGIPNTEVIPNFADEEFFVEAVSTSTSQHFVFFILARMEEQKGIDILLKAFALVKAVNPTVKLRIAGEGSGYGNYKKLASTLKISEEITWLLSIDRHTLKKELNDAGCFVLPSRHEGLPITLIEAIACGRPVIGTVCGGPEEIVNDTNGYLVPPEDSDALAAAMLRMIENHGAFDSTAIRRDFEARFSSAVVCGRLREVYERVIGG